MIKNIKHFIDKEFSDHYRTNGSLLVEFIKYYYEWASINDNAQKASYDFLKNQDIDTTDDKFISFLRNEFMQNIPENIVADERLLLKNIVDFYKSKGSESSYKLLFRILFNEEVSFYYPGKDMLRVSDGKWFIEKKLLLTEFDTSLLEVVSVIRGLTSGATAKIERYQEIQDNGIIYRNLYISGIFGEFLLGENIVDDYSNDIISKTLSVIITTTGKWLNTDGFISSDKYIQDNFYYQEYSYEIQSGRSLTEYQDVVRRLVHPAGTKLFGKVVADLSVNLQNNNNINVYTSGPTLTYDINNNNINSNIETYLLNELNGVQNYNINLSGDIQDLPTGAGTIRLDTVGDTILALGAFTVNDLGSQTIEEIGSRKFLQGTNTWFNSQLHAGDILKINDTTNSISSIVQVQTVVDQDTIKITENYPYPNFATTSYQVYDNTWDHFGNIVTNWKGTGGATGSPGTEPTGYDYNSTVVASGLSMQRISITPYEQGFIHRIRIFGTPGGVSAIAFSNMPAFTLNQPYDGQSWNAEMSIALVAGTMTNLSTFILRQRQVGGIGLSGITPTGTLTRYNHTQVMPAGSTDLRHQIRTQTNAGGVAVDATFDFYAPVLYRVS